MKGIVVFLFFLVFVFGCQAYYPEADDLAGKDNLEGDEIKQDILESSFEKKHRFEESAVQKSDRTLNEFRKFENYIDTLLNQGHGIGNDVYDPLIFEFSTFKSGSVISTDNLDRIGKKLSILNPGLPLAKESDNAMTSGDQEYPKDLFAAVEEELDSVIRSGSRLSEDHQQRIMNDIATLESSGVGSLEVQVLRDKLDRVVIGKVSKDDDKIAFVGKLPECTGQTYSVWPNDLKEVYEISPLGGIGPPGHTIPTNHMYIHISGGQISTRIVDLKAPGDIFITAVTSDSDDLVPSRTEYSIDFALCKEVYGYFNHVKSLSDEFTAKLDEIKCEEWNYNPGNACQKRLFYEVKAGTVIGGVGHKQGNFDFGSYDLRKTNEFANLDRYGDKTPHIVCPIELYENTEKFYDKVKRTAEPRCGQVMQDIKGTLQGNWFSEGGSFQDVSGWSGQLAFVHDSEDPNYLIISVGGLISDPEKWKFIPKKDGDLNRQFSDVRFDGNVYCYDQGQPGRIIVEMTSETSLKIEKQSGNCIGNYNFLSPTVYNR